MRASTQTRRGPAQVAGRLARLSELQLGSRLRSHRGRNAALLALLRRVAQSARADQAQPFYSIREVAKRFHFSPTTVSRVFAQLKNEGLLAQLWGSSTVLEPVGLDRQLRLRGVVAQLIPIAAFAGKQRIRDLVTRVSDQLWQLRFACRSWFYEESDANRVALFESVISAKPDAIIWIMPNEWTDAQTHRFINFGIPVFPIHDGRLAHEQIRILNHIASCRRK